MFSFSTNPFIQASNEGKTTFLGGCALPPADHAITPFTVQAWSIPREAKFVLFTCFGPGGQGGAGSTSAGGGGGGSGNITSILYPTKLIPEIVYLYAGNSLAGESPGGGNIPTVYFSAVALVPDLLTKVASKLLNYSGGGTRATSAITTTPGSAGSTSAATTIIDASFMSLGTWNTLVGGNGTNGGTSGTAPTDITALASSLVCGGTGGSYAGTTQNAAITGAGIIPTIIAPATAPSDAPPGFWSWKPICGTGGPGGGGGIGTGGTGGNGSYGSGGGGGGRGSVTGGNGGDGGPGLVIVTWW